MAANPLMHNWDLVLSGMLRCVYDVNFLEKYAAFIKPKFFYEGDTDPKVSAMRKMYDLILDIFAQRRHREILGTVLSFEQEVLKFADGEVMEECKLILKRMNDQNDKLYQMATSDQLESQYLDYLKMVRIREWSQEFNGPWRKGNMLEAQRSLDELSASLKLLNRRDYIELEPYSILPFLNDVNTNAHNNFRIGIPELDQANGWIEPKTLNLFAAPPGGGKSMMANSIIRLALLQKKFVHITVVENRPENFIPRLVASLTGVPIYRLKNEMHTLSSEKLEHVKKAEKLIAEHLTAVFMYGQGIEAVHAQKIECDNRRNFEKKPPIDIDIVDYTGHVVHYSGNADDGMHIRFRNAYAMRKDFALKTNKICFDFVQINRSGSRKNDTGGAAMMDMGDLATSFDLAQVCDTLITINAGRYDKEAEEAKLYIAKGREGGTGKEILIKTHFKYGRYGMNHKHASQAGAEEEAVTETGLTAEVTGDAIVNQAAPASSPANNVIPYPVGGKP